jgi:hypothetical protein
LIIIKPAWIGYLDGQPVHQLDIDQSTEIALLLIRVYFKIVLYSYLDYVIQNEHAINVRHHKQKRSTRQESKYNCSIYNMLKDKQFCETNSFGFSGGKDEI